MMILTTKITITIDIVIIIEMMMLVLIIFDEIHEPKAKLTNHAAELL